MQPNEALEIRATDPGFSSDAPHRRRWGNQRLFSCEICGNIVEVKHEGAGELVCCGESMSLFEEKTVGTSTEKYMLFVKREADKYTVKIGENTLHPMEDKHYIEWIELIVDGR